MVMSHEDIKFVREAKKHGQIELVKRYNSDNYNRCSVTLDKITRLMDISDRLWLDLYWPSFMAN
jgi:hypothetical protein